MSTARPLRDALRQMLALLEGERQALAAIDIERILACAEGKAGLCEKVERYGRSGLDEECRALLDSIARLNEINRRLRNLIAANVESRLGMLTGKSGLYLKARPAARREMKS